MMVYGKTPFQHITNHVVKLQCIMDPSHVTEFPDIKDKRLLDVMKVSFVTWICVFDTDRSTSNGFLPQTFLLKMNLIWVTINVQIQIERTRRD